MNCIRKAPFTSAHSWSNTSELIVRPSPLIPGQTDGKVVLVGEISKANGYAFLACGIASELGDGNNSELHQGRWQVDIKLCVIPQNPPNLPAMGL